jgi:hypothetical protein
MNPPPGKPSPALVKPAGDNEMCSSLIWPYTLTRWVSAFAKIRGIT